ncbi:MAG: transcriptional repressor [Desulfovibrio sp.]|nr:transcriptional repressor [Desulfovibrio sp.]
MIDWKDMLARGGLAATEKRLLVVHALAEAGAPATPQELLAVLGAKLNRVTLYRILDLLVEHRVAARHNAGERAFRYCLSAGHEHHAHFTCSRCGHTECLDSGQFGDGLSALLSHLPMRVDTAEIRFGGVCRGCQGG